MQQPNNFTIIQSFAGKIITTGKTKGRENNKYNLVKNTDNEQFYVMFCLDGKEFYFSEEHLNLILPHSWYINLTGHVATNMKINEKRTTKYLYNLICGDEKNEKQIIKHLNGNRKDCRINNLEWINNNEKEFVMKKNKKLPIINGIQLESLPNHVQYRCEDNRQFFVIEKHEQHIKINKRQWSSSKSSGITIEVKYQQCLNELERLNKLQ